MSESRRSDRVSSPQLPLHICFWADHTLNRPLAPAACFTTELKFIALASGVLYLDCLRVVDLNTQEATDIKDVPDIVAVEKTDSEKEAEASALGNLVSLESGPRARG